MLSKMRTIYEIENPIFWVLIVTFVLLILGVILFVFIYKAKIYEKNKLFFSIICVFFVILLSTMIANEIDAIKIYTEYTSGNYFKVEGIIENYCIDYDKSGNVRYDEFQVNGVEFTVGGFAPVGYSTTKAMGSQLDNDIGVKIHYIPYKYTNIITHLEISEE